MLAVEGGRIRHAGPRDGFDPAGWPAPHVLEPGQVLVPGLVDAHCHGGFGADFPSSGEAPVRTALDLLHRHGTTTTVASLVTASEEDLLRAVSLFGSLATEGLVAGIHLEGPFLSHIRCGAQDPQWLRKPDLPLTEELIRVSRGTIRVMSYAPELPGSRELVEFLTAHAVVPSIGHTDADAPTTEMALATARDLLRSGPGRNRDLLPTVTHLFNAMPAIHHRNPGPALASLRLAARGEAIVELIADGTHVDPYMVAAVFELVGADNIALVTDSMAAAGLPDGTYRLGPAEVRVTGAEATLKTTGAIAGGTATMVRVLKEAVEAGVRFGDALRSATVVPARVLGLTGHVGRLAPGLDADAVVLGSDLQVARVMRKGTWIA
ncbi:N-acetylglucosamine-6-phosphate deacetylase [Arthrobacter halodurans]|uniref:N-acetylglucosamine-6-phosphate deacetylase n=1 Tax=Arthrobacter halodurans TaxID=516699 RepID=A0ABV4UJD6_9MICC